MRCQADARVNGEVWTSTRLPTARGRLIQEMEHRCGAAHPAASQRLAMGLSQRHPRSVRDGERRGFRVADAPVLGRGFDYLFFASATRDAKDFTLTMAR